jgi:tRNA 2-selenouridine synthase
VTVADRAAARQRALAEGGVIDDLAALLHSNVPLIDVRSPSEFARGAFDQAINLPLLDDDERRQIGIRYKERGQRAAIELGEHLISGAHRQARIRAWVALAASRPDAVVYCWRGGLRSEIVQRWCAEAGARLPRVAGGFKALRNHCVRVLARFAAERPLVVLTGYTGSGKTKLLRTIDAALDLEAIANHRGSAFGGDLDAQPTPVHFENRLAVAISRLSAERITIEDESRTIGRLALPLVLFEAMQTAPLVVLDVGRADRSRHILDEYVTQPLATGTPPEHLLERYRDACSRIQRRLGGARHNEIVGTMDAAFRTPFDPDGHVAWIELLLRWYYDPMYDHQTQRKAGRIVFRGAASDIAEYLRRRD